MDAKTIQTYNLLAKEYDEETHDFWERFPRTFLDKFARLAKGKVLDIGSGPGRDGLLLKDMGIEVICLDASEAMVKMCEEKGMEAVTGDFNSLTFRDSSFEGVWAYTSILHVPKSEVSDSLREIKRVLRQGGILGLGLIEGETEGYRESSKVDKPRWFSFYTKDEVEELLKIHNFEVIYFEQFMPKTKNYLNFIAKSS